MPVLTDEAMLVTDTFLTIDPLLQLRSRAQQFIASHPWKTPQVFYGDQREPIVDEYGDSTPLEDGSDPAGQSCWSFSFALGLDHVNHTKSDWFADVAAILDFLDWVYVNWNSESDVSVRFRTRLWLTEHITFVDGQIRDRLQIKEMIENVL